MRVRPATPPTTPPTTVGVDGLVLPPDPDPVLAVDEGAVPVELLEAPPIPPGKIPVLELVLELVPVALDDDRVEDPEEVDEVVMVDDGSLIVEVT